MKDDFFLARPGSVSVCRDLSHLHFSILWIIKNTENTLAKQVHKFPALLSSSEQPREKTLFKEHWITLVTWSNDYASKLGVSVFWPTLQEQFETYGEYHFTTFQNNISTEKWMVPVDARVETGTPTIKVFLISYPRQLKQNRCHTHKQRQKKLIKI